MSTLFTKIINGEIPSYKVGENEYCYAFLDINPLAIGHTLVVPKQEVDYYFDLENEIYTQLNLFAKEIAIKIKKVIPCQRIGSAVVGFEVPHTHIHLVPLNSMDDLDFKKERVSLSNEEMTEIALKIIEA